jgi:hypothetical protein
MPITISGSTGIAGVDGSAGTPAVQGTDTNTGIFFPAADTIAFGEGGSEAMRINSSGNVGIGTSSPNSLLELNKASGAADFRLSVAGTLYGNIYASSSDMTVSSVTAIPLKFGTNNTERMRIDSSGNLLFDSGYGSVATAYGCRAWVNFNGTGTVAIRASGNVSSITDFATGDYQVNITNAMPDANYAFQVAAQRNSAGANIAVAAGQGSSLYQTASTFRVLTYNSAFVSEDPQAVLCAVFR